MQTRSCVYGAGGLGREWLAHRRSRGLDVDLFIDRAARTLGTVDGVPVIEPDALDDPAHASVTVALHSPGVDVAGVVADLRRRGCVDVSTPWAACRDADWRPAMPFWLDPGFDWAGACDEIAQARALLRDETSRRVFDEQVALRARGDYAGLSPPTPDDQYVPADLPRWSDPVRLVDCGAYDGDTLDVFERAGYRLDAVVALEPDPANFARLEQAASRRRGVRALRAGAASATGKRSFAANGTGSARIDASGSTSIDVVRIDDVDADVRATLIKMDIEGAEGDALEGARETLATRRPGLAISAYHRIDDLWRLPLRIDRLGLGYRFALRSHAYNGFDTVLYARIEA